MTLLSPMFRGLTRIAMASMLSVVAGASAPDPSGSTEPTLLRLEKRAPDYRFRFHTEYRLPGQRPIALALRGGSAKGLAHLGVLQGFDAENLPVDAIVGTSAGSLKIGRAHV